MGFLKKLFTGGAPAQSRSDFYPFAVTCNRCGEVIEGRVNLSNDLSADYENGDVYHVRKVLMGSGRCFQQVEVELKFDASRNLLEKHVQGGRFVE
jgi:hypothetical protein